MLAFHQGQHLFGLVEEGAFAPVNGQLQLLELVLLQLNQASMLSAAVLERRG